MRRVVHSKVAGCACGPRPLPTDHWRVPAHGPRLGGGPAPPRQVAHAHSRGVASFTTPRLREPKWTPVTGTAAWVPGRPAFATPWGPRCPPTEPRGPLKVTRSRAAALGRRGRALTEPAGGGMQAGPRGLDGGARGAGGERSVVEAAGVSRARQGTSAPTCTRR